jgi:vesicle-associated membrane protein 7
MILAEHSEGDAELEELAVQCLERVPPLHSRLTHTTRRKMYSFLMDGPFVYCAIVDEALEKSQAFVFLEHVRDEFKKLLKKRGCEGLSSCCFDEEFGPVYKRLVAPLVGVPQIEKDRLMEEESKPQPAKTHQAQVFNSLNSSVPLYDNTQIQDLNNEPLLGHGKKKKKDQATEVMDIIRENGSKALDTGNGLEVIADGNCPGGLSLQKSASFRSKGQQLAQRMWWRNVRLVLIIDVVICTILFGVWLVICSGFQCISQ